MIPLITQNLCSKTWSATGFYADVKFKKKDEILDVRCIMTNYHDFLESNEWPWGSETDIVAVFHREGTEKETFEIPLVPFIILAQNRVCTKY